MEYALITGASKGIGKAMAECLAKRKFNLLLVARSEALLSEMAAELQQRYQVAVSWLATDLSTPEAPRLVADWVAKNNFSIAVLINNAGYGLWGKFGELSYADQNNMLQLNVQTLVNLTYLMLPNLKQRPKAYILNVGSLAGFQAIPTLSLYAASKALVNTFTRGLARELKNTPVSVTLLAPGGVKTGFLTRSGMYHMQQTDDKLSMKPEVVAEIGIRAMLNGKREAVPGFLNRFTALMVKLFPKSVVENITESMYKKK